MTSPVDLMSINILKIIMNRRQIVNYEKKDEYNELGYIC